MGDWYTEQEEWELQSCFESGMDKEDIAKVLCRTVQGIENKAKRMGLIRSLEYCLKCGNSLPKSSGQSRKYCDKCQIIRHREVALESYYRRRKRRKYGSKNKRDH
jgi:hypothetical protein